MDNEIIRNNDTFQLQQMVIFLKSELAKCQNEIARLKESDYYSLVINLEQENTQLASQKKELLLELMKLKKAFEKEMQDHHEDIQTREKQRLKQIASIQSLVKNKNDLLTENRELKKAIEATKSDFVASKLLWMEQIEQEYRKSVENLDSTLLNFTQKNEQQLLHINDELVKSKGEIIANNQHLLKEIKDTSNKIGLLMNGIEELKELQQESPVLPLDDVTTVNSNTLSQLDIQVHKVLNQSMDFENQLDRKLRILDELEFKLAQLAHEIDNQ